MNKDNLIFNFLMEKISIENGIIFLVVYFFIVWITLLIWVIVDILNRTNNIFLRFVSVLLILLWTPFWIFVYFIIRPKKTLFQEYNEEVENNLDCLNEEIRQKLWYDNLEKLKCFNCDALVEKDFKYCPECKAKLMKKCKSCTKKIAIEWNICPYCWW